MRSVIALGLLGFVGRDYSSPLPDKPLLLGGVYVQPETLELAGRSTFATARLATERKETAWLCCSWPQAGSEEPHRGSLTVCRGEAGI